MTVTRDNPDEIWTFPDAQHSGNAHVSALSVEFVKGLEPLDEQLGVDLKRTVPDALYEAFFGDATSALHETDPAGGDPLQPQSLGTYAILDAARIPALPQMLQASGLEHRCLFKGEAYEKLGDVAPWIVRLEDGNRFTRGVFTKGDAHWQMWGHEAGIFVRSAETLDDLWRHFRSYTRVQNEKGHWFYFRFWEAGVLCDLALNGPYDIPRGLLSKEKICWAAMWVEGGFCMIAGAQASSPHVPVLSQETWDAMGRYVRLRFLRRLREKCLGVEQAASQHVDAVLGELTGLGFKSRAVLTELALWWCTRDGARFFAHEAVRKELVSSRGMPDRVRADRLKNMAIDMDIEISGGFHANR